MLQMESEDPYIPNVVFSGSTLPQSIVAASMSEDSNYAVILTTAATCPLQIEFYSINISNGALTSLNTSCLFTENVEGASIDIFYDSDATLVAISTFEVNKNIYYASSSINKNNQIILKGPSVLDIGTHPSISVLTNNGSTFLYKFYVEKLT